MAGFLFMYKVFLHNNVGSMHNIGDSVLGWGDLCERHIH